MSHHSAPIKMKALTIRQPWAHAILHLRKDVENRVWRTHYRGLLLIHAAARRELHSREMLSEYMSRPPSVESLNDLPIGCIIGVAEIIDCVKNSKSRWADRGTWHWLVRNARPIRPVDCTGRLGLWTPSPAVMKRLPVWLRRLDGK
jgi:hypothetical protein